MFKQIGNTEKPDIACAKMLEGRVVVLVDGSPLALTLPFVLLEDFQSADDYYKDSSHASFVRVLRIASCFITALLPGLYIAMQMFHYKAVPLSFLVTIINSTQGLPLTPVTEILFVLVLFEILYEASLRMPEYLGIALSVVGALILGDTAVKAGLISSPAVMIVALSGITLYTIPDQANQLSLLRVMFTIVGAALGFYGIIVLGLFFVVYLCDYDNYRSPYLAPFAPIIKEDLKDSVLKVPLTQMRYRPKSVYNKNRRRMD
jgi:spore germination protein KA